MIMGLLYVVCALLKRQVNHLLTESLLSAKHSTSHLGIYKEM